MIGIILITIRIIIKVIDHTSMETRIIKKCKNIFSKNGKGCCVVLYESGLLIWGPTLTSWPCLHTLLGFDFPASYIFIENVFLLFLYNCKLVLLNYFKVIDYVAGHIDQKEIISSTGAHEESVGVCLLHFGLLYN